MEARRKKKKTSTGPRALKSGYWQEGDPDWNVDVFEWISAEDLLDEPPADLAAVQEVVAYTEYPDTIGPQMYDAPEYRPPSRPFTLEKGLNPPRLVDQSKERSFDVDILDAVDMQDGAEKALEDADVVTSLSSLRMLMSFVDGTMSEDFRAKGMNTRRRNEPDQVDLMRISRLPDAPNAIVLPCVWDWVPENMTMGTGALNKRSYTVGFQRAATGQALIGAPPSVRNAPLPKHFRLLRYEVGDLKMMVRVPLVATISSLDAEDLEGEGVAVDIESINRRDTGELWSRALGTRYAVMKLGDSAMIAQGIVDKGELIDVREITREDLRLDRPSVEDEAASLLGKLQGVLRRISEVADSPGCKGRQLYLQYNDAELRIIAPRLEDEEDLDAMDDDFGSDVAGPVDGGDGRAEPVHSGDGGKGGPEVAQDLKSLLLS